ncbi:alpha/beta hydrolase [Aspergillus tanneri]|uniref:AB hydrolase-1 domain-containing protein n=1 Tax=Aspergillus tanneri TaxID=1220188 RepID=A0A5M9MBS2_9EURO|nr:uncharacterized protein ATNIH1004_010908 [Aspergillus tanneri]KAA8641969.1 hypothetical protein ATNIH1004_010908 [Aspergillus tanneri]
MTTKPIIVFVHGPWHTPPLYAPFRAALHDLGFEVHIPTLMTMNGVRPPNADLYTDSTLIREYVSSLSALSNALVGLGKQSRQKQGLCGGISRLVYLSGFAVREGEFMIDVVREHDHMFMIPPAFDFADDDTVVDRDPKTRLIGHGMESDQEKAYLEGLKRWNGKGMYQELHQVAWREIPVSYVVYTLDMAVPKEYQMYMIALMEANGREVEVLEMETSHCGMIRMPMETADIINEIAERQLARA